MSTPAPPPPDPDPAQQAHRLQEELDAQRRAGNPIPYETLVSLAAAIADLRRTVRFLESVVDRSGLALTQDIRGRVARLTGDLDALATQVAELAETVTATAAAAPRVPAPDWSAMPPDTIRAELARLTGWAERILIPGYRPDPPLTACWQAHGPVVWELGAVAAEWRRVYDRPAPDLTGALELNNRYLPGALGRVRRELAKCTGRHCALTAGPPRPA